MNERIKELSLQVRATIAKGQTFDQGFNLYTEKFAEAIINEAALFLNGAVEVYSQEEQDICDHAAKSLKRYFGVN